jgi:hypothetical protein
MKKKLMPMAVVLIIVALAAIVFAADPPKSPSKRPPTQRPGARMQRPGGRGGQPKARGLEMMIQQQAKRIESEITRITKTHETAIKELQAILKQAKEEKATKTAALLNAMIEKKNATNAVKVKEIQKRADDFKKRMQRRPKQDGKAGPRPNRTSGRGSLPPRTKRTRGEAPAPKN